VLGDYTGHGTTGLNSVVLVSNRGRDLVSLGNVQGINYGFQYYGRSGSPSKSCVAFGGNGTFAYSDFAVGVPHVPDLTYLDDNLLKKEIYRGKSGRYTVPMQNSDRYTGSYSISGFDKIHLNLSGKYLPREDMLWVAAHNSYDNTCRLNGGIHLFDDEPFRHVESYYLTYDTTSIDQIIGNNKSPIRIGNQVPAGAVNLARITSPNFNSDASISNIDLSNYNLSNLLAYKGGEYAASRGLGSVEPYTATGSFKGINSGFFTGRANVKLSGQIYSDNIDITSVSIISPDDNLAVPAYYYYLVGRGRYGVLIDGAAQHPTLSYSGTTTGNIVSDYVDNLEKIKNNISIKNSNGQQIPFDEYPYELKVSPFTVDNLYEATRSGLNININGVTLFTGTSGYYDNSLPTGVFSVILLLNNIYRENGSSAWVHYTAYDFESKLITQNKSEVINPSPIMRKNLSDEVPLPGRYSTELDSESLLYTVNIFGVDGEYTGKL